MELKALLEMTGCSFNSCETINELKAKLEIREKSKKFFVVILSRKDAKELAERSDLKKLGITSSHMIILSKKQGIRDSIFSGYCNLAKNPNLKLFFFTINKLIDIQDEENKKHELSLQNSFQLIGQSIKVNRKKFLVVDDTDFVRKTVANQLRGSFSHCYIKECINGKTALDEVKKNHMKYDFVIMDLNMPIMNGLESTKKIREFERSTNLKHLLIIRTINIINSNVWRQ